MNRGPRVCCPGCLPEYTIHRIMYTWTKSHPEAREVYEQRRVVGGMTTEEAAESCGISPRTWQSWEQGTRKMPWAAWRWFQVVSAGLPLNDAWTGWTIHETLISTPEGDTYRPQDLLTIPWLRAAAKLRAADDRQKNPAVTFRTLTDRHQVYGRMQVITNAISRLENDLREDLEDRGLRNLADDMHQLLLSACQRSAQVSLLTMEAEGVRIASGIALPSSNDAPLRGAHVTEPGVE